MDSEIASSNPQLSAAPVTHLGNADDADYHAYLELLQARFDERTSSGKAPLFTTDADEDGSLFEAYLAEFPAEQTQFHRCNACKQFLTRFGTLVTIGESGAMQSAMFDESDAPELYAPSVRAILKRVRRAKVTGVFLPSSAVWGQPLTISSVTWRHLAIKTPNTFRHSLLTASQAMAAKHEDHNTVARALADFSQAHLETAVQLLRSDALYRSEKVLGQAEWLLKLHTDRAAAKPGRARDNVLWLAIAQAPAGFCHPKASMIGSLLEDIAAGKSFDDVARSFASKMHPLQYARPQAAPTAGAVAAAEKLFATMGLERSLKRRFARIEDVVALWKPKSSKETESESGIFSHLRTRDQRPTARAIVAPPTVMTFEKFARTVLPTAEQIELMAPTHGYYCALVTAEDPEAPPILQWDSLEQRNPVSWYVYNGGSQSTQWCVRGGTYVKVNAITKKPMGWHSDRFQHHGDGILFILDGARDTRNGGLALFPETLRSELHAVRSVIEAHSNTGKLSGAEEASACGLVMSGAGVWRGPHLTISVTSAGRASLYQLDRMD